MLRISRRTFEKHFGKAKDGKEPLWWMHLFQMPYGKTSLTLAVEKESEVVKIIKEQFFVNQKQPSDIEEDKELRKKQQKKQNESVKQIKKLFAKAQKNAEKKKGISVEKINDVLNGVASKRGDIFLSFDREKAIKGQSEESITPRKKFFLEADEVLLEKEWKDFRIASKNLISQIEKKKVISKEDLSHVNTLVELLNSRVIEKEFLTDITKKESESLERFTSLYSVLAPKILGIWFSFVFFPEYEKELDGIEIRAGKNDPDHKKKNVAQNEQKIFWNKYRYYKKIKNNFSYRVATTTLDLEVIQKGKEDFSQNDEEYIYFDIDFPKVSFPHGVKIPLLEEEKAIGADEELNIFLLLFFYKGGEQAGKQFSHIEAFLKALGIVRKEKRLIFEYHDKLAFLEAAYDEETKRIQKSGMLRINKEKEQKILDERKEKFQKSVNKIKNLIGKQSYELFLKTNRMEKFTSEPKTLNFLSYCSFVFAPDLKSLRERKNTIIYSHKEDKK